MAELTPRQMGWTTAADEAAREGNGMAAGLFSLIAMPNDHERQHDCREHALGFSRDGRRGFRCGICRQIVKWVD